MVTIPSPSWLPPQGGSAGGKPGKKEVRKLLIEAPREKIVQKAIQITLDHIYEKEFLDCSHGFRPGRSPQTALKRIHQTGDNYT